ncbi:MAG TPA: hypothetical protein VGO89_11605, partial [Streptomyces sp.]|nr:hypothetical protein [Streptomyces sp.]
IAPLIGNLNAIRRRHPALRQLRSITFHPCENDQIIAFSKHCQVPEEDSATGSAADVVVVVVNLDPHNAQEGKVSLREESLEEFGLTAAQIGGAETFPVRDELSGRTCQWGRDNYVRLAPGGGTPAAHILTLRPAPDRTELMDTDS